MSTVMLTTLATLPPARFRIWSICEKTWRTCASKFLEMSAPWLSRVAVCPATQTVRPPSVMTPGESARESWNGVFSMYSAALAASGKATSSAASGLRITGVSFGLVLSGDQLLEALIGTEPDRRHDGIEAARGERIEEGEGDRDEVDRERQPALEVAPERLGEDRIVTMQAQQHAGEDGVGDRGPDQHRPVGGDGQGREVVLVHPAGDERHEGEPEEQMKVCPQHPAADAVHGVEQMVVVVPVDADHDEAQHVAQEDRHQRQERLRIGVVRNFHLE